MAWRKSCAISDRSDWFHELSLSTSSREEGMSKSPEEEEYSSLHQLCPWWDRSIILNSILTLDDESEAKTAKGQVSKHRLFLWLADNVTFCDAAVKLECQGKLSGLNIRFNLMEKQINVQIDATAYNKHIPSLTEPDCR